MKLTVIISYYKAPGNLQLILQSLNNQSCKEFEVIISEDDNNEETISIIKAQVHLCSFPVVHLHQDEDKGFRKNMMLNRSLVQAASENVVFIDGDCIPHRHFVKEYIRNITDGYCLSGRAVMLGEKISGEIVRGQYLKRLNFCSLLLSDSEKIKDGIYSPFIPLALRSRGIVGRNWGIRKKHLFDINGFDEDYMKAGVGEDADIRWRLVANGIKIRIIKNKAIVYHLYHRRSYSENDVQMNWELLKQKKQAGNIRCLNGIEKIK